MRLATIDAFIKAAGDVLMAELGTEARRGRVSLLKSAAPTDEVTTLLSFTGALSGTVIYAMELETALAIVSHMLGQDLPELDELGRSGIAELGNVITGRAMTLLAQAGYACELAPPVVTVSKNGAAFPTLDRPRLAIPLQTDLGRIDVQLAFRGRG